MEIALWAAIIGTCTLAITVGGLVWKLATRISNTETKAETASTRADSASIAAAAQSFKIEKVASELAQHREDTAKEYVSYKHLVTLENRLVDAIANLGNRIDGMFSRMGSASHA